MLVCLVVDVIGRLFVYSCPFGRLSVCTSVCLFICSPVCLCVCVVVSSFVCFVCFVCCVFVLLLLVACGGLVWLAS